MNLAYNDYLKHHGIKGQKWGIRRYQNPDGSLTEDGKKRYGDTSTSGFIIKKFKGSENFKKDVNIDDINNSAMEKYSEYVKTEEGKKLETEYKKAREKWLDSMYSDKYSISESDKIEKQYDQIAEKFLRKELEFEAKELVNEYGAIAISGWQTYNEYGENPKFTTDVNEIIKRASNKWQNTAYYV